MRPSGMGSLAHSAGQPSMKRAAPCEFGLGSLGHAQDVLTQRGGVGAGCDRQDVGEKSIVFQGKRGELRQGAAFALTAQSLSLPCNRSFTIIEPRRFHQTAEGGYPLAAGAYPSASRQRRALQLAAATTAMRAFGMPPVSGGTPQYRSEGPTLLDRRAGAGPTQARRSDLNHREKFVQSGDLAGTDRTATLNEADGED